MMDFFEFFAMMLALYATWGLISGEVGGKSGAHWRTYTRAESPFYYWSAIVCYYTLAFFVFVIMPALKAA